MPTKHLYVVFDFKTLETKVLAIKQKGETTIKIYPFAIVRKATDYSVQDGNEYREFQYNSRKDYKVVFRSEMTNEARFYIK